MKSATCTGSPGSVSGRSSPRPCTSCATRPGRTCCGTTSTDLTDDRQPQDVNQRSPSARLVDAQNAPDLGLARLTGGVTISSGLPSAGMAHRVRELDQGHPARPNAPGELPSGINQSQDCWSEH